MNDQSRITRRDLLRAGVVVAGTAAVARHVEAQQPRPYAPFRMGIQSYSLRGYKELEVALAKTRELGLRAWEAYSAHVPLTSDPAEVARLTTILNTHNVRVPAHGVSAFGKDAAANRKVFEAAKALGIRVIAADPEKESLDQLDGLVKEFDIKIAIHNHGPNHRYDKLQSVLDAVKGRDVRLGACVDTGHTLRSREDPVEWIKVLGERVHGIHLKDVKDATHFPILGKGDLKLVAVLKLLKEMNYREVLALEYEENPANPIEDIKQCLAAVREALKQI